MVTWNSDGGNLVGADCMRNLRWANTEPSMQCGTFAPIFLPTPNFTSKFTHSFISNIPINLLHHDECNIISQVRVY